MRQRVKWSITIAASVFAAILIGSMAVRHAADHASVAPQRAEIVAPRIDDTAILAALQKANVPMDSLTVRNVDGIVLVRGTADKATTDRAVAVINGLGFTRVANLVREEAFDDENLRRAAERQLAGTRSLDGCMLKVSCLRGVIHVSGTFQNELQQDVARNVLRGIQGAHGVEVALTKI